MKTLIEIVKEKKFPHLIGYDVVDCMKLDDVKEILEWIVKNGEKIKKYPLYSKKYNEPIKKVDPIDDLLNPIKSALKELKNYE